MKLPRAFTLIELLVVITIIGTLAATVLVAMNSARARGNDTGVKADLATIQTQASLYFGIGNTYGAANNTTSGNCTMTGTLFNDPTAPAGNTIVQAITSAGKDATGGINNVVCHSNASKYSVGAKLSDGQWWCVDNTGAAFETTKPTTIACPTEGS